MNKKVQIIIILVAVAVSFYFGTLYQKRTVAQTFGQNMRPSGINPRSGARVGTGFISGSILSKDATSITVSTQGGGSKILLISSSTVVSKTTNGSLSDLTTGIEVTVDGTPNSDGSITAKTVQVRPAGAPLQRMNQ